MAVMNDFLPHVDGRAIKVERDPDYVNRTYYPGAEPTRLQQDNLFLAAAFRPNFGRSWGFVCKSRRHKETA
jgi:hypothetical protein